MSTIVDSVIAGDTAGGTTKETGTITVSGSNRVLWVWLYNSDGSRAAPSSVKWRGSGGTSLTQIGSNLAIGSYAYLSLWELKNPDAATDTVYATWGSSQSGRVVYAVSMSDVDQTTPKGTVATATGTGIALALDVASTAGLTVLDFAGVIDLGANSPDLVVGSSQTQRENLGLPVYETTAGSHETATGSTTDMDWSLTNGAFGADWGTIGFAVNDATGGGAGGLTLPILFQQTNTLLRM